MARRGKRRSNRWPGLVAVTALAGGAFFFRDALSTWSGWFGESAERSNGALRPPLTTDRPETAVLDGGPYREVPEKGEAPVLLASPATPAADARRTEALLQSARRSLADNEAVLARGQFTEVLQAELGEADKIEVQAQLRQLSRQTIFSSAVEKGDPFSSYYVIAPGDSLQKIAQAHAVTAELLARVNGLADPNRIRAGQRLKVVKGPFHARVDKSSHTLDVFLGTTLVEHYRVGLGSENGTPTGEWRVRTKLKNPTYYPPRGGTVIGADDPTNPLGERWIGLKGVSGEAVGQERYGIHGTIEPESIGRNASMGCVRLLNEDVELLFDLLVEGVSTVEIREGA